MEKTLVNTILTQLETLFSTKDLIQFLKGNKIEIVYLYGSISRNQFNILSDIDIAIVFNSQFSNKRQKELILGGLQDYFSSFDRTVQITELKLDSIPFVYRVIADGIILYCSNEDIRINFECQALSQFFDFEPYIKVQNHYELDLEGD